MVATEYPNPRRGDFTAVNKVLGRQPVDLALIRRVWAGTSRSARVQQAIETYLQREGRLTPQAKTEGVWGEAPINKDGSTF